MSNRNILQALQSAGGAGGAGLDVDEVFSTYLYDGTGSAQTITNGIDLDGEGGLVWTKSRSDAYSDHLLFDTERGALQALYSHQNNASENFAQTLTSFNSNGFSVGTNNFINKSSSDFVSWSFLKSKRFFDVVTYTGNGTLGRTVSHNLGSAPACIFVKRTSSSRDWRVYHRGMNGGVSPAQYFMTLNETDAQSASVNLWNNTEPTSSVFTVGLDGGVNTLNQEYVAYLFAHNDGDGGFGPDGDADSIKCGSYTGTGASQEIDLGFEAQWVLIKNTTNSQSWAIIDNMRGFTVEGLNDEVLTPNDSSAEASDNRVFPTASGFGVHTADYRFNGSGSTYIYIAIRRGSLFPPESATDVFATAFDAGATDPTYVSGFVADMGIQTNTGGYNKRVSSRLTSGRFLEADGTGVEGSSTSNYTWDFMDGWNNQTINSTWLSWMWKRAPNFCDVVAYTGNGTAGRTVSHNLGVAPEMIWTKRRDSTGSWIVLTNFESTTYQDLLLNSSVNATTRNYAANQYLSSAPTATEYVINTSYENDSGATFIAYLFASLDGISKVGSYTGNGSFQTIDCGFSAGSRFVLIKRTDATGDWYVWDSERGITQAADPYLELNTTAAETTGNKNYLYPANSGFGVQEINGTNNPNINVSGATYIFYAIA